MSSEPALPPRLDRAAGADRAGTLALERLPFALSPDADFLFWTRTHREAADALARGIETRAPVTLLTGETGSGKTLLLQELLSSPRDDVAWAFVSGFGIAPGDPCAAVLLAFGQSLPDGPAAVRLAALLTFLKAEGGSGRRGILVVDEAQSATDAELEAVRQLTNLSAGRRTLLQIVLAGQPVLRTRLADPRHAPLVARIGSDAHLLPMSLHDTAGYVAHRLARAGGRADIFGASAIEEVHRVAGGSARTTNLLCDLCLREARRRAAASVDAGLVRDVLREAGRHGIFGALVARQERCEAATIVPGPWVENAERQAPASLPSPRESERGAEVEARRDSGDGPRSGVQQDRSPEPPDAGSPRADAAAAATAVVARPPQTQAPAEAAASRPGAASGEPAGSPSVAPSADAPAAVRAEQTEPGFDVRELAVRAMASLDHVSAPSRPPKARERGDRRKPAAAAPDGTVGAPAGPGGEAERGRSRAAPPLGQMFVMGAAAAALAILAVGLWSGIVASTGAAAPPPPEPAGSAGIVAGSDEAARGRADTPLADGGRPALLPTPSLPTVAAADATADDLYLLALELAALDPGVAAVAFARAAARGHARAAYYLAQLYETGDGVPLNPALARAWYAASGRTQAEAELAALSGETAAARLDPPQLVSAARTSEHMLELVWTASAAGLGVEYVVELFDAAEGKPLATERVALSAHRMPAPDQELLWRVTAAGETGTAASPLERIPAAAAAAP